MIEEKRRRGSILPKEKTSPKLAVFFNRIGPYHDARIRALRGAFKVTVIEDCKWDSVYRWNLVETGSSYEKLTLFEKDDPIIENSPLVVKRVYEALDSTRPSVAAILGWSSKTSLAALSWCIQNRVPRILMSESGEMDFPREPLKELVKSRIVRLFNSALVGGKRHREYLLRLGFPADSIFTGYDVVDNGYFENGARKIKKGNALNREKRGLPKQYFLASSRFIEKKNLGTLLKSYADYSKSTKKPWGLVLLGDGPERENIVSAIKRLNIGPRVKLPGFVQYEQLPAFYGSASAFILASTSEQWGLVVNEAMASGLPVLVSKHCGCSDDLVIEGVNGWSFEPQESTELSLLMNKMAQMTAKKRSAMGRHSQRIIRGWSTQEFGTGMRKAANRATAVTSVKMIDKLLLGSLIRFKGTDGEVNN